MTNPIRLLNELGLEEFRRYLTELRSAPATPPPFYMLSHPSTSSEAEFTAVIQREPNGTPFQSRFEFGTYLAHALAQVNAASISREHRMWTWLALYYFDQLCPPNQKGVRTPSDDAAYVLNAEFSYTVYYRHLVRTPWIAAQLHPVTSKVILTPLRDTDAPLAQRGELVEQIASRPNLFRSATVMTVADRLYYDPDRGRPRKGTGGSGAGSPRRFAAVLNQFDLTYDLESVTPDMIIGRLPKEFDRWKNLGPAAE
jgi:hypothetical protein